MAQQAEDIISLPIEISDKVADSKFRLVHMAAQRVRELSAGHEPLVRSRSIKDTTVALEESLLGQYRIVTGEEAKVAREELRKREERERLEEQLSAKEEEIRKELSAYLTEAKIEDGGEAGDSEAGEGVDDGEPDAEDAADEDTGEAERVEE